MAPPDQELQGNKPIPGRSNKPSPSGVLIRYRRLQRLLLDQEEIRAARETIYPAINFQARSNLKYELGTFLGAGRTYQRAQRKTNSRRNRIELEIPI